MITRIVDCVGRHPWTDEKGWLLRQILADDAGDFFVECTMAKQQGYSCYISGKNGEYPYAAVYIKESGK